MTMGVSKRYNRQKTDGYTYGQRKSKQAMETHSTSLITRQMQIKIAARYRYTPAGRTKFLKRAISNADKDARRQGLSSISGGNAMGGWVKNNCGTSIQRNATQ